MIKFLDGLPKNSMGKVTKKELKNILKVSSLENYLINTQKTYTFNRIVCFETGPILDIYICV